MRLLAILICISGFFLSPCLVFAAVTINSFSPTTINNQEDVVTIFATASGLQNSTQYLEVSFTKEGESANYFGWTKNLKDEWYQYKSSPSTSDLSSFFYNFIPVGSSWSGQLQTKIDTTDAGFKGPGNYNVKLFKFITSSPSHSNTITIVVNVPLSTSSPPPVVATVTPMIDWTTVENANLGDTFKIKAKLVNFDPNQEYFFKIRGGTDESTLNKIQTQNGISYLSDTENWEKFPIVKTSDTGSWEGEQSGRVSEDKDIGNYFLRVRLRKKNSDTTIDSTSKQIKLIRKPVVVPVIISVASASATIESFLKQNDSVLGTQSSAKKENESTFNPLITIAFVVPGLILAGLSIFSFFKSKGI